MTSSLSEERPARSVRVSRYSAVLAPRDMVSLRDGSTAERRTHEYESQKLMSGDPCRRPEMDPHAWHIEGSIWGIPM